MPPAASLATLARRLERALGPDAVLRDPTALRAYDCDGLTSHRQIPALVVLPETTEHVAAAVRACAEADVPFTPRGAGTGLSGGAIATEGGVVIALTRMRRILRLDPINQRLVAQPGVTNREISLAAAPYGLYYAPDPSSQVVCTIGGNVAENSGGAHCLKYGFTTHHVLGVELVTPEGAVELLGSELAEQPGLDLRGLVVGAEGTLGIVTAVTVRLLPLPQSVRTLVADFPSPATAGDAVTAIVGAGITPAAIEMLDALAIQACEAATNAGFALDAGAVLVVELDGPRAEVGAELAACEDLCRKAGAERVRIAADDDERDRIWSGRKAAFAAMGRLSPSYLVQDGVIPRTRLREVLARIAELAAEAQLRVANVFHAGDGNLHPLVLFDPATPGEAERAEHLSTRIVELCVEAGGSITGEHGVGLDKACALPRMFSEEDLAVMDRVRAAFDPAGRCNPGKVLPTPRLCGDRPGPYRPHPLEAAGVIDRW